MSTTPATPTTPAVATRRALLIAAVLIASIELTGIFLDPAPLFFMGDSRAYVMTAVSGHLPPNRSFVYGWLIRWLALWPGTLTGLVLAQTAAAGATAWLLAVALLDYFEVRPVVAITAAILLALDPLQILHERMVLTEAFTLLLWSTQLLLGLRYLRCPAMTPLVAAAIVGVAVVSLRIAYVPVVVVSVLLLPVLAWHERSRSRGGMSGFTWYLTHLAVAGVAIAALHAGYRHLVGDLFGSPPAYQYEDGFFLASAWAPLVHPSDADDPRLALVVERQRMDAEIPLQALDLRWRQRWDQAGLVARVREAFAGNAYVANGAMKRMCLRIIRRDPVGIAHLTLATYAEYWQRPDALRQELLTEQGSVLPLPPSFVAELQRWFGVDFSRSHATMTLSKRYHLAGGPWYMILVVSPILGVLSVWCSPRKNRPGAASLCIASGLLLAVTCAGAVQSSYRFLHPLSFTALISLGVIFQSMTRERR
ncbi:MAG: hypothetical protein HY271_11345 [Deltaproteobacteria bacterium]|nr:hypothetical protein [Deltaproteobacteria bacterium]